MKITIESTDKIVTLTGQQVGGGNVKARVWQGETDSGIPVQCFIPLIRPEIPESNPDIDKLTSQFETELKRLATPRPSIEGIPMRFFVG